MAQLGSSVLWHESLPHRPRPEAARGELTADVLIVGAGYTGLWAAYQLTASDPSLDVAVVDAHDVAFGASGRNGGFAMTLLDFDLTRFATNWGDDAAAHAHRAVARSVIEIEDTVETERIDADLEATGLLRVATNPAQLGRIERELATMQRLGLDGFTLLDADQTREQLDSPTYLGGLQEKHCVLVNPAKLAVGLADVLRRRGVRIYEGSPVLELVREPGGVRAFTPAATIVADTAIWATNAWAHRHPAAKGWSAPFYTYVVVTEPLSDAQWESIGWRGRQGVEDARNFVHYFRPTPDGRILWGGTDAVYRFGGPISSRRDRHERIRRRLERELVATFPQLGRVRFTHHWGGPIALTSRFVPRIGTFDGGRIHYAFGYSGHGVGPAHTAGRVLRDLVLDQDTDDRQICFVERPQSSFPPEPLTWIGAELSRQLLQRQDRQMDAGHEVGAVDPFLLRLLERFS